MKIAAIQARLNCTWDEAQAIYRLVHPIPREPGSPIQSRADWIDQVLDGANAVLHAWGVEAIRGESLRDPYYGDALALYVNRGDTYTRTLLYDIEADEILFTSWGDWVEKNLPDTEE